MVGFLKRVYRGSTLAKNLSITAAGVGVTLLTLTLFMSLRQTEPAEQAGPPRITEANYQQYCGWAGPKVAAEAWQQVKGQFPAEFKIVKQAGAVDKPKKDSRAALWVYMQAVLGNHLPAFRQETGDCVSMGASNACMYLLAKQLALDRDHDVVLSDSGKQQAFKHVFPPYIYGISRVQIGGGTIRGAGSTGSWAAAGVKDPRYGVLNSDAQGCPPYSGQIADKWGNRPGPPAQFIEIAKANVVKSAAKVTTWQEVRDAIQNGYPVTVASMQGFRMSGTVSQGKLWLTPSGSWAHQMVIIGYDFEPEPCFCILNSWGPDAHGTPPDDAPPGSFWVKAATIGKMVGQDDSFAYSDLDGFYEEVQWWDVDLAGSQKISRADWTKIKRHKERLDSPYRLAN